MEELALQLGISIAALIQSIAIFGLITFVVGLGLAALGWIFPADWLEDLGLVAAVIGVVIIVIAIILAVTRNGLFFWLV